MQGLYNMEGFYRQKVGGQEVKREDYSSQGHLPLGKIRGLIGQMTSLVLTRKFQIDWSKIPFLGGAGTVVTLSIKSSLVPL